MIFLRTIYRSVFYGVPFLKFIEYHYDGMAERFNRNLVNVMEIRETSKNDDNDKKEKT